MNTEHIEADLVATLKRENERLEKRYDNMASQIVEETTHGSNLMIKNAELLDALDHAVNWTNGYGFPEDHKPVWMPQAEEAIRKAKEKP